MRESITGASSKKKKTENKNFNINIFNYFFNIGKVGA